MPSKGPSISLVWPGTVLWSFFEPEVPKFSSMKGALDLADAAVILYQNQPGMRREVTQSNLMHISFSFDVGLAWFLALSELPRLQTFRK